MPWSRWDTISTLAWLADEAYDLADDVARPALSSRLGAEWIVLGSSDIAPGEGVFQDGYFAFDYGINSFHLFVAKSSSGELVLSIRGTDERPQDFSDYRELVLDVYSLTSGMQGFLRNLYEYVDRENAAGGSLGLYITGHSLGGALAEAVALANPSYFAGGAFLGSPGSTQFGTAHLLGPQFVHVTHFQDSVGDIFLGFHGAATLTIDDYDFLLPTIIPGTD